MQSHSIFIGNVVIADNFIKPLPKKEKGGVGYYCQSAPPVRWFGQPITSYPINISPISWDSYLSLHPATLGQTGHFFCFGYSPVYQRHFIATPSHTPNGMKYIN